MNTLQPRQRTIADEVRNIRNGLRKIAASLHPGLDENQRAVANKKITKLEKRIAKLEARKYKCLKCGTTT